MKPYFLMAILFLFQSPVFAKAVEDTGLAQLKNSVANYLSDKTASDAEIKNELKQLHARLALSDEKGNRLNAEQAKVRLARQDAIILTVTWPNGSIKIIRLSPDVSGEVVNAIRKTYTGFGGTVSR